MCCSLISIYLYLAKKKAIRNKFHVYFGRDLKLRNGKAEKSKKNGKSAENLILFFRNRLKTFLTTKMYKIIYVRIALRVLSSNLKSNPNYMRNCPKYKSLR